MPLPTPTEGEDQDRFESRCMGSDVMKREFPNQDQRYAVCRKQWERRHAAKTEDKAVPEVDN